MPDGGTKSLTQPISPDISEETAPVDKTDWCLTCGPADEQWRPVCPLTEGGGSSSGENQRQEKACQLEPEKTSSEEQREEENDDAARACNEEGGEEPAEDQHVSTRKPMNLPTREAQKLHEILHVPFRSWCRACNAGRRPNHPHYATGGNRMHREQPEVWMDYCFFRDSVGEPLVPVIVAEDRESSAKAAHVIPAKGGGRAMGGGTNCP